MEKEDQAHDTRPRYKGVCEACQGNLHTICKNIAQEAGLSILGYEPRQGCNVSIQQILGQGFERETWEKFIEKMKGGRENGNGHERV